MRFSERQGYRQVRSVVQIDDIDQDLRTALWNVTFVIWRSETNGFSTHQTPDLGRSIWYGHWNNPADEVPGHIGLGGMIKSTILQGEWFEAYDLIEFIAQNLRAPRLTAQYQGAVNNMLEKYLAGYRMLDGHLLPIDSDVEVSEIEAALGVGSRFSGARHHFSRALELLADRENPDYANSVKESVSAVESVCKLITDENTLGKALGKLDVDGIELHPALKDGWKKVYGYTSDADGIRHFALELPTVDQAIAKYFLVSCSAFVNFLIARGIKAGIFEA